MKTIIQKQWSRFGIAGLALAASIGVSWAGTQVVVNQFDSAAEVTSFVYNNWNGSPGTVSFSANDATGSTTPGSMKMQITYDNQSGVATNLGCSFISTAGPMPLYLSSATAVEFDLMVDPASPLDANGNAFYFQLGFNSPSFQKVAEFWLGPWGKPFTPGVWMHVSNSFAAGTLPAGFVSQLFINPYDDQYTTAKTPIVYIDNIKFDKPTFPDYTAFTFSDSSFLGGTYTNWFGTQPTAVGFSSDDAYGSTNSGSAYIYSPLRVNENDSILVMAFDTNWAAAAFPNPETNVINGADYIGLQLDVKWDTINSTIPLSLFNARGDISGIPIGLYDGSINEAFGAANVPIPNAASNGWARIFLPLDRTKVSAASPVQGLQFKKYGNGAIDGVGAYWIDNVIFIGAPTAVDQPTMSISKPVPGLNLVTTGRSGNPPYDREDLETFNGIYSFVDQGSTPVTYSIKIASIPPASVGNYRAWIVLDPTAPINAFPDYADANVILLNIQRSGTGSQVIVQCKTNQSNGNGSLGTLNSTWITPSKPEGNWSFTFTQNTNILVYAPDGSTTNLPFPLGLASSDVSTFFGGGSMYVLFGGFNNGVGIGQRVVLSSVGITNGSGANNIFDNFLTDTIIQDINAGGPWIPIASSSYATTPAEAVFLTSLTTSWYVDWSVPAPNFGLQTNTAVNNASGWGFFGTNAVSQLGDHFHAELDVTNLPPSGPLFFRVKNPFP